MSWGFDPVIEIPGYTILRLLGHGGMATVYLAQQKSLGREVALKVLTPALASDKVATERFLREARVSAKLHHPNIVAIFDVGVHEGVPYMAIAYEPGGTVAGYAQAKNDPKVALRIIRDIANALDFAHRQGVVHRDVKPENILLRNDGTCVLSDFGIAHAIEGAQTGLTREGTSVGTPHYMSPEQLRGEHVDARADIYSLGVVLFQLLTGELPYQGTDGWAIGMQHIGAPIPHLPPHLDNLQTFLDSLLAKNPDNRLQSGAEVVHWIDARLSGQGPAMTVAMPTPMPTYTQTPPGARGAASIAILPFADLSQTKDQDYLADGLTEELCNLLAKVGGLFVASRSSAARFKGSTAKLAEIGRELKVATVLEGSVRKFGDRVRISVQLINVADGFQRWSETYDRTLTDVFEVQDEIAGLVVVALKAQLLPNAEAEAAKKAALLVEEGKAEQAREREAAAARQLQEGEREVAEERRQREIGERIMQRKREREEAEQQAEQQRRRDVEDRAAAEQRQRVAEAQAEVERGQREEAQRVAEAQARAEAERAQALALAQAQRDREQAEREAAERQQHEQEEQRLAAERRRGEEAELAAAQERKRAEQHAAAAKAAAEQAAAEKAAAKRAAAERAAAEKAAAAKAATEKAAAERAAAEQAAEERSLQARADAQRESMEREAAEQRRRDQELQAETDRRRAEAERASAVVAATVPTSDATGNAPEDGPAEAPTRDPAREFASAYLAKPEAQAEPRPVAPVKPASGSALTPARLGIAAVVLLVLGAGGWLLMQNARQKDQVACQAALLQGQTAIDAAEFDAAATSALQAHGVCRGDSEALLQAFESRLDAGKATAQACTAATTQARGLLRSGRPKAAAKALAPLHERCLAWPGFPELEALPANASAQAKQLVERIGPLLQSGATGEAQAMAVQAEMLDAEAEGLPAVQAELARRLGQAPK